jgi:hypothetical protein
MEMAASDASLNIVPRYNEGPTSGGKAAKVAEEEKISKIALPAGWEYVPLAIESGGKLNKMGSTWLTHISKEVALANPQTAILAAGGIPQFAARWRRDIMAQLMLAKHRGNAISLNKICSRMCNPSRGYSSHNEGPAAHDYVHSGPVIHT